jgi:hypothetical protein
MAMERHPPTKEIQPEISTTRMRSNLSFFPQPKKLAALRERNAKSQPSPITPRDIRRAT